MNHVTQLPLQLGIAHILVNELKSTGWVRKASKRMLVHLTHHAVLSSSDFSLHQPRIWLWQQALQQPSWIVSGPGEWSQCWEWWSTKTEGTAGVPADNIASLWLLPQDVSERERQTSCLCQPLITCAFLLQAPNVNLTDTRGENEQEDSRDRRVNRKGR